MDKIIRSICVFSKPENEKEAVKSLDQIEDVLGTKNFIIQTKRICFDEYIINIDNRKYLDEGILLGFGDILSYSVALSLDDFITSVNKNIILDLTRENISTASVDILFKIIKEKPENTFNFAFGFGIPFSSPYFPSAVYTEEGFSIGLQPTDLSENCKNIDEWLMEMRNQWSVIETILRKQVFLGRYKFLGIDSSVAPVFSGRSSFINLIKRMCGYFNKSVLTDTYTKISKFIKEKNPKPIGLCGLMFPCLEDFELAEEYEKGNFSIERNLFLSLHSGTGIDTYPIGIDEDREKVLEILRLVQALSNKYGKPLSVRFVSDGTAKIGDKTDFKNQYLKDVVIRPL